MLRLANNPLNLSMVWVTLRMTMGTELYYQGKDDWPSGMVASYILRTVFLDEPENLKKSCRFVWAQKTGRYNPLNGTFDGAIGMVAGSKADAYIMPIDIHQIPEGIVSPSSILLSISYLADHLINKKQRSVQTLESLIDLLIPSLEFLIISLAGVFVYLVILCLLSLLSRRLTGKRSNLKNKILAFFFLLYCFFVKELYNDNLNTESISVDVSDLLHSEEQYLNTDREPCFLDKDGEFELFANADKSSLAFKIFEKRNKSDPCFWMQEGSQMGDLSVKKNLDKLFFLGVDAASAFAPKIIQLLGRRDTFINMQPILESPRAIILGNHLKKVYKDYFNLAIVSYSEFGFFQKGFRDFPFPDVMGAALSKADGRDEFKNYDNLASYIEDNSEVVPLSFPSLDYLFRIYASVLVLLLCTCMAHYLLIFVSSALSDLLDKIRTLIKARRIISPSLEPEGPELISNDQTP